MGKGLSFPIQYQPVARGRVLLRPIRRIQRNVALTLGSSKLVNIRQKRSESMIPALILADRVLKSPDLILR